MAFKYSQAYSIMTTATNQYLHLGDLTAAKEVRLVVFGYCFSAALWIALLDKQITFEA